MPKIPLFDSYDDLDDVVDDLSMFEPIRKNTDPINEHHDFQRRSENGLNRFRNARQLKERSRMPHMSGADDE